MVAKRRDGEGKLSVGPTWESIVERQIREAMDEGAFEELPYSGQRLPIEDDSAAGERALGFRVLRNAGVAPPWIEADKEVRNLLAQRDALLARAAAASSVTRPRLRRDLERLVAATNLAIDRLNTRRQRIASIGGRWIPRRNWRGWRRRSAPDAALGPAPPPAECAPHARNRKRTRLRWPFVSWAHGFDRFRSFSGRSGPLDRPSMAVRCTPCTRRNRARRPQPSLLTG